MSNREASPLTEMALFRLTTNNYAEIRNRAVRLGQALWRIVDLLATNPSLQEDIDTNATHTRGYKMGRRVGAWLDFTIPEGFEDFKGTPAWLEKFSLANLQLNTYDVEDLPEDMTLRSIPGHSEEVVISLAPAPEYLVEGGILRNLTFIASYEENSRLDAPDTEAVIGVLALLADKAQAEVSQT